MQRQFLSIAVLGAVVAACSDGTGTQGAKLAPLATNASAARAEIVPNEYIVVLRKTDAAEVASQASRARALGGLVVAQWTQGLVGLAVRVPASKLEALRSNPNVAYVEQSQVYHADAQVTCVNPGSLFGCPWGWDRVSDRTLPLNNLKAKYANNGTGVTIYSIDTGVNFPHTEFGGRASSLWDSINNDADATDDNGHGTHTSSTMAGINYGFAVNSTIKASKVLNSAGSGTTTTVIDGINRVTAHHVAGTAAVANMSLGGGFSAAMNAAVAASVADGVVYAVAAGNSATNACSFSPASEPSANTIAASGNDPGFTAPPAQPDQHASYSNFGTCVDGYAPGTNILGAYIGSTTAAAIASGTSMASPHFAGVAAVYLANFPGKTPAQVSTVLWNYSTKNVLTLVPAGTPNKLLHNSKPSVNFTP